MRLVLLGILAGGCLTQGNAANAALAIGASSRLWRNSTKAASEAATRSRACCKTVEALPLEPVPLAVFQFKILPILFRLPPQDPNL
jgi:hypothetical protein